MIKTTVIDLNLSIYQRFCVINIFNFATSAINAGLNAIIVGEENSGKLTVAKAVAENAPIFNSFELTSDNLESIRSICVENKIVILKSLNQRAVAFMKPILKSKSILGSHLKTQFIITSNENIDFANSVTFHTPTHSKDGWINWAKFTSVDNRVIDLVETNEEVFEKFGTEKLSLIAQIVRSHELNLLDLMDKDLTKIFGKKERVVESSFDLLDLIDKTDHNELLNMLKNEQNIAKHLAGVVANPKALSFVSFAIKDKEIQRAIDSALV